jgi:hypothetical protein
MPIVAGDAAQPFMHTHRRAVIARARLCPPLIHRRRTACFRLARRMALVADRLPSVLAHSQRAGTIVQLRNRLSEAAVKCMPSRRSKKASESCTASARHGDSARQASSPGCPRDASDGMSGKASSAHRQCPRASNARGPCVSCGWTRSRTEPLKCIPWQRRQSSIIMRFELCTGSAKIWL